MVKHDTWSLPSTPDLVWTVSTKLPRIAISRAASVHRCGQWLRMNPMKRSGFYRQNQMKASGFYRQRNQLANAECMRAVPGPQSGSHISALPQSEWHPLAGPSRCHLHRPDPARGHHGLQHATKSGLIKKTLRRGCHRRHTLLSRLHDDKQSSSKLR